MTASFTQPSRAEPSRVDPVRAAVDFFWLQVDRI
jgi:hypothetical protein